MKNGRVIEVWPVEQIKETILRAQTPEAAFLLSGLFGTGARLREFLSLKKKDFTVDLVEGKSVVRIIVPTFKNRRVHARTVHLFPEVEAWFTEPLMQRVAKLSDPESPVLQKSGRWVEKKFKEWFGKHPHFFRHCRCTYNYTFWNMKDVENQAFLGWSDTQPAATYTHLKENDIVNSMLERMKGMKQ